MVGLDISPTYCINDRWEVGGNISVDYYLNAKANNKNGEEKPGFLGIGFGADAEYYTFARHFSIGLSAEFNYIVDFDGFSVTVLPYLKYTFDI